MAGRWRVEQGTERRKGKVYGSGGSTREESGGRRRCREVEGGVRKRVEEGEGGRWRGRRVK